MLEKELDAAFEAPVSDDTAKVIEKILKDNIKPDGFEIQVFRENTYMDTIAIHLRKRTTKKKDN